MTRPINSTSVGFTGTRKGMTDKQFVTLTNVFSKLKCLTDFHQGCAPGADRDSVTTLWYVNPLITVHSHPGIGTPPTTPEWAANSWLSPAMIWYDPKPYIERDHDIVDATQLLIATPDGPERLRSGTWTTVRYAKKLHRPIVIIDPRGYYRLENFT